MQRSGDCQAVFEDAAMLATSRADMRSKIAEENIVPGDGIGE
jgi:hypothetical protein